MTLSDFETAWATAEVAWGKQSPEKKELYWQYLQDADTATIRLALSVLVTTETFFPPVAKLFAAARGVQGKEMTGADAVGLLNRAIRKYGYMEPEGAKEYIAAENEALAKIVVAIGWRNICTSDESRVRAEVERLYREEPDLAKSWDVIPAKIQTAITRCRQRLLTEAE